MPETTPSSENPPTPPAQPTPPAAPQAAARPPQKSIQPRRFSLVTIGLLLLGIFLVVAVAASLGASGSCDVLSASLGLACQDLRDVIYTFINAIYFIAGIITLITLLIGGFRAATSLGNPREAERGRHTLAVSLVILLFLIGSYVVIYRLIGDPPEPPPPAKVTIATTPEPPEGPVPFQVAFRAESSYTSEYSYLWDFGDGASASALDAMHEYTKSGDYTATLYVKLGGQDIESQAVQVRATATAPAGVIIATPLTGPAPLTVAFDGTGSKPGYGASEVTAYAWDFGDSAANEDRPNTAEGSRAEHVYARPGKYTATLVVTDDTGTTGTTTVEIAVQDAPEQPIARIISSPTLKNAEHPDDPPEVRGLVPLRVSFSGAESESPLGKITEYAWNFGDGTENARGRAVEHTYNRVGEYLTVLTITDDGGRTGSMQVLVRVSPQQKAPVAKIEGVGVGGDPRAAVVSAGQELTLSAAGSTDEDGSVVSYAWDFGDGTTSVGERVQHAFQKEGEYIVKLVVTDDTELDSAPATYFVKVTPGVAGTPRASVRTTPSPATGVAPFTVKFDASASQDPGGAIVDFIWRFNDGTPEVHGRAMETHVFEKPGLYTVDVTVVDADGNTARASTVVAAQAIPPLANIEVSKTVTTVGTKVSFNGAKSGGNISAWRWDFGDGTSAKGREVEHAFTAKGFYTVTLVVSTTENQTDDAQIRIEVQ